MNIELPENMSDLNAEELSALIVQLEEAGATLSALENIGEEETNLLVAVASALDEAQEAFAAIEVADDSKVDLDALKSRFATKADDADAKTDDKVEELSNEDDAKADDADAKTEELSNDDDAKSDDDAADAKTEELSVSLDTTNLEKVLGDFATGLAETLATKPDAATPAKRKVSTLSLKRAGAGTEKPGEAKNSGQQFAKTIATDAFGGGKPAGTAVTNSELAEAIFNKSGAMGGVAGFGDKIPMATSIAEFGDNRLTGDLEADFEILKGSTSQWNSLVASGGNCAPLQVSYEFTRKAQPQSPVESCLPVVATPRGGIRFIPQTNFRDAAAGVRITTEAQDQAGYTTQTPAGPTPPKPCVRVVCPAIDECRVDVVSQCVTFGNLNYRAFPEQIESFLQDLAVIYAETKEVFYLDAIEAASTNVTAGLGFGYGMVRDLINDLTNATTAYRRRNNMDDDSMLDLYLPSWVAAMAKVDMINDHSMGLGFVGSDVRSTIAAAFSVIGVRVCWYYHGATGAGQNFAAAQVDGTPLNAWPLTVVSYIHCPGTFVRLDGGTLDLGVVRDSTLNGTNDLQIFAEQWIQVCHLGQEALRIEHTLCPNGGAPEPATLFSC